MATQKNALVYCGPRDPLEPLCAERENRIQESAYFRALRRRFAPGHELDDWLAAEEEASEWLRLQQGD